MAEMSIAEALREAIREEMRRDSRVFCIGEDIGIPGGFGGAFTVTLGLSEEFGHERILDTPISEEGLTGVAIGAAMAGLKPIVGIEAYVAPGSRFERQSCVVDGVADVAELGIWAAGGFGHGSLSILQGRAS